MECPKCGKRIEKDGGYFVCFGNCGFKISESKFKSLVKKLYKEKTFSKRRVDDRNDEELNRRFLSGLGFLKNK